MKRVPIDPCRQLLVLMTGWVLLVAPFPALAQTTIFWEDFDGAWTTPNTLQSDTCASPPCLWSGQGSGDTEWHRSDYTVGWSTSLGGFVPGGAEGTAYSARFHSRDASAGAQGDIRMPWSSILGTNGPLALIFWFVNPTGIDSLFVSYTHDGVNFTRVLSLGTAATWTKCYANLGPAGGFSSLQIRFEAVSDDGDSDIQVDNMVVQEGLAGVTYVGQGQRLQNLTQAVAEYGSATVVLGPAAYRLTADYIDTELIPLSLVSVPRVGGNHLVTFGPDSGVVSTTSGSSPSAVFIFDGANYCVLDGGSGWTISNTNNAGGTAAVWLRQGASNNAVRRLTLSCGVDPRTSSLETFGILSSGASISNSSDGVGNDGNVFEYNTILNSQWGMYFRGSIADPNDGVVIRGNVVGPAAFGPGQLRRGGIVAQHQNGITISENEVRSVGLRSTDTASASDAIGIGVGSNVWPPAASVMTGAIVARNTVHGIVNEKGLSAGGIVLASTAASSNNTVANNFVRDIRANGLGSDQAVGIGIGAGSGDRVVFNSLSLYGDLDPVGSTTATQSAAGVRVASASAANLTAKNNVSAIGWTSNNGGLRHYAEVVPSTAFAWGTGGNDHNDYWPDPVSVQATLGGIGTVVPYTAVTTLLAWRTQFTPNQDIASVSEAPPFMSVTDLHLQSGIPTALEARGFTIAGVLDDYDGQARNLSVPDIGADEGNFTPLAINHAPVLRDIADIVPRWGKRIVITPIAHDFDCLPLTFSAFNLPPGASMTPSNGRISWNVPDCPASGYPDISVIVSDSCGASDTTTIAVHPEPAWSVNCYLPDAWMKPGGYPADVNGNKMEDSFEEGAAGDSVSAWLLRKECGALAGANRDSVLVYSAIKWEPTSVPAVLVRTVRSKLPNLAGMYFVWQVAAEHHFRMALDTSVRALGIRPSATYSPATVEDSLVNVNGADVRVVIVDSGVDGNHESLLGKYVDGVSFVSGTGAPTPGDPPGHAHGTATAGAAVGRGNAVGDFAGAARASTYADVKVLEDDGMGGLVGSEADLIAALQYALNTYGPGTIVYLGIEGDHLSYGADPSVLWNGTDLLSQTITALTQGGLIVVVPAGNVDGFGTPLLPPAVAEDAIVVAGVAHMGTVPRGDDAWDSGSKSGPREADGDGDTVDEEIPHVAAYSTATASSGIVVPGAGTADQYVSVTGTSIAAAQVAGVLALMQQVSSGGLSSGAARQFLQETADELTPPLPAARPAAIAAMTWSPLWGRGLVNAFNVVDRLVPQSNVGFDVFCNGPGDWFFSPDIEVLDPVLLGDSVRVRVNVRNKGAFRRVHPGWTVELGAHGFGNGRHFSAFKTFTATDTLEPGQVMTFECKWYVNPGLPKPHGCLKAFIHRAQDGNPGDNCANRNIDIMGYGSSNIVAERGEERSNRPARAANLELTSRMFVANVLPENVQVTLLASPVEGSGWTLACSESTFSFTMVKNEPPREVTFRAMPGGAATDSAVWDVDVLEQGACAAYRTGGGRLVARKASLAGTDDGTPRSPMLVMGPRPFRNSLEITFTLPTAGRVVFRIYDVVGREVKAIDLGETPAGMAHTRWDGSTNGGGHATPGVYFVRAHLGATQLGGRVIRLR